MSISLQTIYHVHFFTYDISCLFLYRRYHFNIFSGGIIMSISLQTVSIYLQDISCINHLVFLFRLHHVYLFAGYIIFTSLQTISCLIFFGRYHHVYFFADGVYLFADDIMVISLHIVTSPLQTILCLFLCRQYHVYFFADDFMSISLQTISCLFLFRRFYDYFFADGVVSFLSQPNYPLFKTTFTIELSTKRNQISQRKIHLRF